MRCELMQMERMAADECFGTEAAEQMRLAQDIRRRMRREQKQMEEAPEDEYLAD